jgi:hypothetical protein
MTGENGADERRPTRRRVLAGLASASLVGLGGCVELSPSLNETFEDSAVFEKISASERWAGFRLRVGVTLTERATGDLNVRGLIVVDGNGYEYLQTPVDSGQTSVVTYLPMDQEVTVAAVDNRDRTVEQVTVRTP